jgi:hypothetical protein
MSRIYGGGANYQLGLGAAQIGGQLGAADPNAITVGEKARAEVEIKKMRSALAKWLKYRTLLGTPASDVSPVEARLGKRLHILLGEMFDAQALPAATAPIALAQIAIAGKLPTEMVAAAPAAAGAVWLWPAVAVVGLVLMTVVVKIKTDAEDAADERHTECVAAGKCTDTGFWLKAGGIAFLAWFAWEKLGLKKMASKG